jgi:hypothetical protein
MNQSWQNYKQKNWQWRVIIWSGLFLIFGKPLGHWTYQILGIDQLSAATTLVAKKAGISDILGSQASSLLPTELVIDVKNDTVNDYTIETKSLTGYVDSPGQTMIVGEVKRFIVKPYSKIDNPSARGGIIFLSAPIVGSNNQTCQEIHTLNYDLKRDGQVKQPLTFNLSAINSKIECKDNAVRASDDSF